MRDGGFDEVGIDAVGNVVGRYRAATADAPILLTGSHYDTVRNAGKYDGRLGIFVPMACVRELSRQAGGCRSRSRWSPSRKKKVSVIPPPSGIRRADGRLPTRLAGPGGRRRHQHARGAAPRRPAGRGHSRLRRDPARYLGFIEVHIEQGPVLYELACRWPP